MEESCSYTSVAGAHNKSIVTNFSLPDSGLGYGENIEFQLKMFGSNLPRESPVVLYLGDQGEQLWNGLQMTGARLAYLPLSPHINSHVELYKLACKAASYIFDHLTISDVYIVGYGIGALLAAKLIADKELLLYDLRLHRLQAVFLISGVYQTLKDHSECDKNDLLRQINDAWLPGDDFNLSCCDVDRISPLRDDYDHLWEPGTRCYVFSARNDLPELREQSRKMFDHLANSCDQEDMHYEIKEKFDRSSILKEMCLPNNFLSRLIRYDINLSRSK